LRGATFTRALAGAPRPCDGDRATPSSSGLGSARGCFAAIGRDRTGLSARDRAPSQDGFVGATSRRPGAVAIDRDGAAPYVSNMATLPIITLPNPLLRKRSAAVERIDAELGKLADDMFETMYAAPGVGLAAVQVGVPRRLIVIDAAKEDDPPAPLVLVNPEIVALGPDLRLHEEGCLSIPDERIEIERPASLTLRFLDRDGKPQELAADGLLATVIQHEIDHLNGKLIIDYLSRLKRDIVIRRFKKLAKSGAGA
jgi:peptide deformylase